jgi:hypothetical protein
LARGAAAMMAVVAEIQCATLFGAVVAARV